jgi:hypothetical protein
MTLFAVNFFYRGFVARIVAVTMLYVCVNSSKSFEPKRVFISWAKSREEDKLDFAY